MNKKPASLGAGLIAKKGQAIPAVSSVGSPVELATQLPETSAQPPAAPVAEERVATAKPGSDQDVAEPTVEYHKALTVKLDRVRYRKIKALGVEVGLSSQKIFMEALDDYLAKHADKF